MSASAPDSGTYEARGRTYEYVNSVRNGPTFVYMCKDCGNHCGHLVDASIDSVSSDPLYHCSTCDDVFMLKGLAPYKVKKVEVA